LISIRRHLYIYLTSSLLLVWFILLLSAITISRSFIIQQFDIRLQDDSTMVLQMSREFIDILPATRFGGADESITHEVDIPIALQIYRDGILVLKSPKSPDFPLPERSGFQNVVIDSDEWRLLYEYDEKYDSWIINGERLRVLKEPLYLFIFQMIWPIFVALPLVLLSIYVSVKSGTGLFKPVTREIQSRKPNELDLIDTNPIPTEIKPLIVALNDLLVRLDSALTSERTFTDNAAHELRTPLAALKTEAQVARRVAKSDETTIALDRILVRVDSATRLVTQLLDLSRVAHNAAESQFKTVNLTTIVMDVLVEMADFALDRNIDISAGDEDGHLISGQEGLLTVMIRNLVDNAVKYTPDGGSVAVELQRKDKAIQLVVSDTGPGISETVHNKIYAPFFRGPRTEVPGSGLGMSIVKRIADLHHATIMLNNLDPPNGLEVRINFVAC